MSDIYDPVQEFEELPHDERQDFLDSLDAEDRSEVIKSRADKRKREKPPSSMGTFGSTMQQIDQKANETLRRAAWEPEDSDE